MQKLHLVEWEPVEAHADAPTHLIAPRSVLLRIRREFTRPGVTRKALVDLNPPLSLDLPLVLVAVRKVGNQKENRRQGSGEGGKKQAVTSDGANDL